MKRCSPRAIRRSVFSASGFFRSKILGHGIDQSIISAAVRHGLSFPFITSGLSGAPCVGSGQTIGRPSRRATKKTASGIVGARNHKLSVLDSPPCIQDSQVAPSKARMSGPSVLPGGRF